MSAARIAIAGAGPVGLALACACRDAEIVVVDPTAPRATPLPEDYDLRVFALSAGTRTFLRDIGAWDFLDVRRVAAVRRMEVYGDADAKLSFGAPAAGALAWIVEAGRLSAALAEQAAALPNVSAMYGSDAASFEASAEGARMVLTDGTAIAADLLVGADGPDSRVRAAFGLPTAELAYSEDGVVANFETEREHGAIARQWFRSDGVLAWLPLPGRRISIVWSTPASHAQELATLDPGDFAARVQAAGADALGGLRLASKVARFPLRMIQVERTVAPGVALVGDAAHSVHPLAGQGVNLGFQDARVLADVLAGRSPLERPGDLRLLRRYARARREDVTAMQFVTDQLDRLFASESPGASWLRNTGLALVDSQPWAKRALAGRAMR
ncbi:MAG TPA: FAD-dependent monooxygenase [Usitatibacter sp.]|nr:FAD-dependent monooxygenase [Usitatibacter sp.]